MTETIAIVLGLFVGAACIVCFFCGDEHGRSEGKKELARCVDLWDSFHFDVGEKTYAVIPEAHWQLAHWGYTKETDDGTVRDRSGAIIGEVIGIAKPTPIRLPGTNTQAPLEQSRTSGPPASPTPNAAET